MNRIIISPPFSNLFCFYKDVTKILGTYTLNRRSGLWRVITTLRRVKGGWINNVGLRNPGVNKAPNKAVIISIAELEVGDFDKILDILSKKDKLLGVEFNISCPNADVSNVDKSILNKAKALFDYVIVKLPHHCSKADLLRYVDMGFEYVHISNTKKTNKGALSGEELIENNLRKIKYLRHMRPGVKIIGGGGIYNNLNLARYYFNGANYFSLSTVLLNPFKTYKIIKANK